jgi:hypothetical protein
VRDYYYYCGLIFWVFIWAYRGLFFVVWLGFFVDVDGGFVWDDDDDEVLEIFPYSCCYLYVGVRRKKDHIQRYMTSLSHGSGTHLCGSHFHVRGKSYTSGCTKYLLILCNFLKNFKFNLHVI